MLSASVLPFIGPLADGGLGHRYYLLDFLGLNDRHLERDLEDAILREIEQFLLLDAEGG